MANWKSYSKYYLIAFAAIILLAGILAPRVDNTVDASNISEGGDILVTPSFFGKEFMPNFVGSSLKDSVILLEEEFEAEFEKIQNIDTDESLKAYFYDDEDIREVEGLFVCTQNVAPGADPADYVILYYLEIEVSESCAGKVADFHMGPSAKAFGVWSPLPLNGFCDEELRNCGDTVEVDGIFVRFLDGEEWRGHKIAVVKTGVGEVEAELAWIEPATEWCGLNATQNDDLFAGAMWSRDQILQVGQKVRLVRTTELSDGLWFFHRLNKDGALEDGQIPELSVNEQLVSTGYWTPDAFELDHEYEDYYQPISQRSWVVRDTYLNKDEPILLAYGGRLTAAANLAFGAPNAVLASCIQDQQDQLESYAGYWNSNDDDDDSRNYVRNTNSGESVESDGSWTPNCEGEAYYEFPILCDGGNRLMSEFDQGIGPLYNGTGIYSGIGKQRDDVNLGGGGSNCTWVDGYTRKDGTRVKGHPRCG
jgi:hypothetical protein